MKFKKIEFQESDYESDFDARIQPIWRPNNAESEMPQYKPVKSMTTPTGRVSTISSDRSPVPPTEFEKPLKFDGLMRPKFEPIDKYKKSSETSRVLKPKPVSAKPYSPPKPNHSYPTQYYTATAGPPYHNQNPMATEISNTMQMREQTESCHRVVNMSSTKRVIHFDKQEQQRQETTFEEQYPFQASSYTQRPKLPPPPTPVKFIPSEFRESDYDSEVESVRIRPRWTPNPSDSEEPHFRSVKAPTPSRSGSVPRGYSQFDRIQTPMEFDRGPVELPSKIAHTSSPTPQYFTRNNYCTQTLDRYISKKKHTTAYRTAQDDMNVPRSSAPRYVSENIKPILKKTPADSDSPQVYREESKSSQYGK